MAIVQVTTFPMGTETPNVSKYVAAVQRVLRDAPEKISFQMTPMATIIEGELPDILAVIQRMHEQSFQEGAMRVYTSIIIDERRDKPASMAQKMKSVEEKM
jgi:uncharacterized protein (TIGR00106 family)